TLALVAEMRAMARTVAGGAERRSLVELKAVDEAYPLYGALTLSPALSLEDALAPRDGVHGAVAERAVLARLGIALGDRVRVGDALFAVRATIASEPDRGYASFVLGPRLMIDRGALEATGLIQPGSLVQYEYRLRLADGTDADAWTDELALAFPEAGWRVRKPGDASATLRHTIERLSLYMTLVGLAALLVGGVGVANAVRSYLDARVGTIATLKCLGAAGRTVFRTYLIQILALAAAGVALGLALGATLPFVLAPSLRDSFALDLRLGLYGRPLLAAGTFGLLVALIFSLVPLARAKDTAPQLLFRQLVAAGSSRPSRGALAAVAGLVAAATALVVLQSSDRALALWFVLAVLVAFAGLSGTGAFIARLAKRLERIEGLSRGRPALRLALAGVSRPGTAAPSIVLSLGIGLTVLVAVALVQANLAREVNEEMPREAPAFFFIDIQPHQVDAFEATARTIPGVSALERVPHLRGRITRLNGTPVERVKISPGAAWLTRSDRGLTYSATPPKGAELVAGAWWPENYDGPPLVSFDAHAADELGVGVGDRLTVNVLGREVEATIANLRKIDWTTLGINFTIVFAPGVLEAAPQTHVAAAYVTLESEDALEAAVTARFDNVSAIRVRDALETARRTLGHVELAVRIVAAVALAAGVLVLAGTVAAGERKRLYEAAVLKALGARRRDVLGVYLIEYALLGTATALLAAGLGTAAAYVIMTESMASEWRFLPLTVAAVAAGSALAVVLLGLAGTARALGQPAAPFLRNA
ncbi:MAG: ABC transporter permease, partial [Alphaproteobacteria bacterium]